MQRHQRLEEDVKIALSNIVSYEIKHPDVTGLLSVTRVQITPDQKYAKVFVSIYNTADNSKVLSALQKSSNFVRHELGQRVKMRILPSIVFELDSSIEYGAHMNKVIDDLKKGDIK
ncbi:Ribosome-binding factor A [compost metagenome]